MNLDNSDLRIRKHTVSIKKVALRKIQQSLEKKIEALRSKGKLTKGSFSAP
ncbi:MAG: hypothetical protein MK183_08230 [Verrucomicrobiales bacterium]|nr:hypothetical protein [Verrucomicrobiales bacterium]MED5585353.1 hypothetical protein [Verrucomicrobiota bacterium]